MNMRLSVIGYCITADFNVSKNETKVIFTENANVLFIILQWYKRKNAVVPTYVFIGLMICSRNYKNF